MKILLFVLVFTYRILPQNNSDFDKYFIDQTFRIDYYHIGDAKNEMITLDKLYRYGIWAGSLNHLIDEFNNGKYYSSCGMRIPE